MMADTDVSKMKVADLKKELKNRGKSTVGNKTELSERLQAALIEGESTLLDESVLNDDMLDDDELNEELDDSDHDIDSNHEDAVLKTPPDSIKSKSPELTPGHSSSDASTQKKIVLKRKLNIIVPSATIATSETTTPTATALKSTKITITSPTVASDKSTTVTISAPASGDGSEATEKKVIKLSELTAKERLELRAKKFGAPIAVESLKLARSERFGITNNKTDSSDSSIKNGGAAAPASVDLLKKRAERFGGSVSKEMSKIEYLEKLQKRSERFGGAKTDENKVTISSGKTSEASDQMAEKARLRLERFKTTVA